MMPLIDAYAIAVHNGEDERCTDILAVLAALT